MKFFTQDAIKKFKKTMQFGSITLKLAKNYKIIFGYTNSKEKPYAFLIKDSNGKSLKSFGGKSYIKILEDEVVPFLKKKGLLLKDNTISIVSTIENESNKEDSLFSFEDELAIDENKTTGKEISEKEIKDFLSDSMYKVSVKDSQMTLEKRYGEKLQRKYLKKSIISIILKEIENLLDKKKKGVISEINKEIKVVYQKGQVQNLNIVETGDNGDIGINGFTDTNLVNEVFTICSIEELAIDKTKLKIWLKKILLKEKEKYIYF